MKMGIDYDMDTAEQERVEDADLDWTRDLCSFLNGQHKIYVQAGQTKEARRLRDYVEKLARLRARQREGYGLERIEARLDELESFGHGSTVLQKYGENYRDGFLRALRYVRTELDAMDATPQRKGEREPDGWIGSCGSCRVTDLIEEWSPPDECPRCGNEDYGVRALNWDDTEPAETLTHDDVVAALEAVDWLAERASRPPVGGAPTPRRMIDYRVSVLRDALDRDTEPPAERELDELTPRCPACRETMHDCECNPYMDTEEPGD